MNVKIVHPFWIFVCMTNMVMANLEDPNLDQKKLNFESITNFFKRLSYQSHNIFNVVATKAQLKPEQLDKFDWMKHSSYNFQFPVLDGEAAESGLWAGFLASLVNEMTLSGNLRQYAKVRNAMPATVTAVTAEQVKAALELKKLSVFRRNPAFRAMVFGLPAYLVYQLVSERNQKLLNQNTKNVKEDSGSEAKELDETK